MLWTVLAQLVLKALLVQQVEQALQAQLELQEHQALPVQPVTMVQLVLLAQLANGVLQAPLELQDHQVLPVQPVTMV